jgi:hypothetical protein
MIAILLASLAGAAIPNWVEQAFMGRPGSKWTAVVAMDRPGPGDERDTGRACRDGTSERLDLHHGSHFMAGDSTVFLESVTHIAWVAPRRHFPTPPDSKFDIVRTEQFLGRSVVVADIQGPHGHGRRLWIDTTLPLVMKSEPLQKDPEGRGEPLERQFLSLQVGIPCPASDFQIPQGWTINHGHPPRPPHPEGRPDRTHRRHEVESPRALAAAVGFEPPAPPWLPAGFTARSWAWIETRQGKAAQILFGDGTGTVSVFFRPATDEPAPYCPASGCKDREGRAVYFGKSGAYAIAATGELSSEQMERVIGNKK